MLKTGLLFILIFALQVARAEDVPTLESEAAQFSQSSDTLTQKSDSEVVELANLLLGPESTETPSNSKASTPTNASAAQPTAR